MVNAARWRDILITHVETTSAPVSDDARTARIHDGLKHQGLLPAQHIVDTGYVDAKLLIESQQDYQIDLVGPTRRNHQWQANQQMGFDANQFLIDWDHHQATCPEGTRAVAGPRRSTTEPMKSLKLNFPPKTVKPVPA